MIYADNASTTQIKYEVLEAMKPFLIEEYANPSGKYDFANKPQEAIQKCREFLAETINCNPEEIYFTSGGTESNNWAIKGIVLATPGRKLPHIITDNIEHHSVLNTFKQLEDCDLANVSYIKVPQSGVVQIIDIKKEIKRRTVLLSVMAVNNETGTMQPFKDIGDLCHSNGIYYHMDAVQGYGKYRYDMQKMHVDLMSVSAHKFGGPKGIGFLYIRKGTNILPLLNGGQQEFGMRSGTENVASIVGMAKAADLSYSHYEQINNKLMKIKYEFWTMLLKKFPELQINGHAVLAFPSIINVDFSKYGIRGEELAEFYNQNNICVSTGSACNSKSNSPSHVLKAIGLTDEQANSSVRFSFGGDTRIEDIQEIVNVTETAINTLGGRS